MWKTQFLSQCACVPDVSCRAEHRAEDDLVHTWFDHQEGSFSYIKKFSSKRFSWLCELVAFPLKVFMKTLLFQRQNWCLNLKIAVLYFRHWTFCVPCSRAEVWLTKRSALEQDPPHLNRLLDYKLVFILACQDPVLVYVGSHQNVKYLCVDMQL